MFNKAPVPPLNPIPVNAKIFWRVHVDLTGQLPTTENGNKYIAIAICAFTKYIEAKGNNSTIFNTFSFYIGAKSQIQISHNSVVGAINQIEEI